MKYIFVLLIFFSTAAIAGNPPSDTANSDYLKGQARLKRENMQSLLKKSEELLALYEGYKEKAKSCAGAKPQWQKATKLSKRANKKSKKGLKLADKAEKAKKMKKAKKFLSEIDALQSSAREDCVVAEERKKEIEFEIKGCN
jgi:hypothetical protein